ncbi:MAG TPA: peptide chain release factor N(5)-glutamine methyltransferase [Blastocatellia bacterium]|nr:peptide chain release factor N(5)-glutamine methyltransferase [Blastocatellia bacterium]
MPRITQAIDEGAAELRASGVEQDRRTAGVLLAHVLGVDRTHLLTRSNEHITGSQYEDYLILIERRAAGEPLQYITGHQEFYGLDFRVTPAVLIPRPETEFLVERIIKLMDDSMPSPLIVDVGTGSGCIAVTVAVNVPRARVIAIDLSAAALEIARTNAERHGASDRIEFLQGDLVEPLKAHHLENSVDVLASNPPYVNEGQAELIQREVRDWEPGEALFGGVEGLDFYRRLFVEGLTFVKRGGYMIFEIGYDQLEAIAEMIAALEWELVDVVNDLQGIPRTVTLRRPG